MEINVKLSGDAQTPDKGTPFAAAFDFYSEEAGLIPRGGQATFRTGVSLEVPDGYVLLIFSRSGQGFRNAVTLVNGTGVIDPDYRGEIMIGLRNDGNEPYRVAVGDRIAQGLFVQTLDVVFKSVEELSTTARGIGGFGSTGI